MGSRKSLSSELQMLVPAVSVALNLPAINSFTGAKQNTVRAITSATGFSTLESSRISPRSKNYQETTTPLQAFWTQPTDSDINRSTSVKIGGNWPNPAQVWKQNQLNWEYFWDSKGHWSSMKLWWTVKAQDDSGLWPTSNLQELNSPIPSVQHLKICRSV